MNDKTGFGANVRLERIVRRLWPWAEVRELRKANERLIEAMSNPLLTGINIGNGSLDIGMKDAAGIEVMAGIFLGMFEKEPAAENYMQWTFQSNQGPIVITAIRPGGSTPDELRRKAEHERDELRAKLDRVDKVLCEYEGLTGVGYQYIAGHIRDAIAARGK